MSSKLLALTLAFAAPYMMAQEQEQRARTEPSSDVGTTVQDPQIDYFDSAADFFRYSPQAVREIHKRGTPVEEVAAVLYLARYSKMTANEAIEARKSGKRWEEIARDAGVKFEGNDFVAYANAIFLSKYHARPFEEVKKLRERGATWVAINQEYRREGGSPAKEAARP